MHEQCKCVKVLHGEKCLLEIHGNGGQARHGSIRKKSTRFARWDGHTIIAEKMAKHVIKHITSIGTRKAEGWSREGRREITSQTQVCARFQVNLVSFIVTVVEYPSGEGASAVDET